MATQLEPTEDPTPQEAAAERLASDPPVFDDDGGGSGSGFRARFAEGFRHFVRSQKLGVASGLFILLIIVLGVFADWIAPHDPVQQFRDNFNDGPSGEFWFGNDDRGRDVFSRVIHGSRITILVATTTVVLSMVLGTIIGVVSGYIGGWLDLVLQRIVDAFMSIPVLILALFIVALLGASIRNLIVALVIIYTPRFSRVARGEMLRVKTADYVAAAEALGSSPIRIMARHGVPNLMAPIIIMASLTFGQAIVAEAALSFLGLGVPPPDPSWGRMLSESRELVQFASHTMIFPAIVLSLAVLAFNLFGDALRDHFDPKLVR